MVWCQHEVTSIAFGTPTSISSSGIADFAMNPMTRCRQIGSELFMKGHFIPCIQATDGLFRMESFLLMEESGFQCIGE